MTSPQPMPEAIVETRRYAPVAVFQADLVEAAQPAVVGYAAPAGGNLPCCIRLVVGDEVLALSKAARYSAAAAAADVRYGWCGFRLGGLATAAALGATVELHCAVSDRVLTQWAPPMIFAKMRAPGQKPFLTVAEFRTTVRGLHGCNDPGQIKPFADHYRRLRGDRAFVAAIYRWLLHRVPSTEEADNMISILPVKWGLEDCVRFVECSAEFREGPGLPVDGPFEPAFPFGLEAFHSRS